MRADAHISITRSHVRGGLLHRHVLRRVDSGRSFGIATATAPPRLWSYLTKAALDGFEEGLGAPGSSEMARLQTGYEEARRQLKRRCDALLERIPFDAMFVGILLGATDLHVLSAGTGRVYVHRRGRAKRLTPRDAREAGLLRGVVARCSVAVDAGDLVLAGSASAFNVDSVAKVAAVLEVDPGTRPSALAAVMTDPATRAGVGAAALALRIR